MDPLCEALVTALLLSVDHQYPDRPASTARSTGGVVSRVMVR
jgi:hypothetical protein